jgi:mono/diheme cytochrome c family protein
MPVDYGTFKGTVLATEEDAESGYQIRVSFASADEKDTDETDEASPTPGDMNLAGLAVLWTSGRYEGGAQIDGGKRDGERMTALQVASWSKDEKTKKENDAEDGETGLLTLRQVMNPPPAVGDTFEILGHKISSGRQLYAQHCQHCHGTSGDGAGPTAKYLNPRPRDYRMGKFKFQSTLKTDRPTDDDLQRIVQKGIPGTYMPSFLLLEDEELSSIVQYVKWLSMRGEYEIKLVTQLYFDFEQVTFDETVDGALKDALEEFEDGTRAEKPTKKIIQGELLESAFADLPDIADDESKYLADAWRDMIVVVPQVARTPDTEESRARGRVLYVKNCAACHGATGRGDGEQVEAYMVNDQTREKYPEPGLFDDWGHSIKPRNLTRGIYRGGRRPIDLFRRVYEGINGTPMPPFKGKFDKDKKINDARIWDLVNYVYHIPFEGRGESTKTPPAKHGHTAKSTP